MRIISLSPSFTEILQAIGNSSSLVGITDHCPDCGAAARVGSPKALQMERIPELAPDLVLSDVNDNRPGEIRELQKNFRVVSFNVRSADHAMDAVQNIGRLAEAPEEAVKLISKIREEYARCQTEKDLPRVRALILLWNIPYLTVNFDTYISRLVEACGGVNVFHSDPLPEFPVELEDMIEKEPEILFLPTAPFPFKKKDIARFRQYRIFSKIPIELVDGRFFSRYGPATVEALRLFRELISKARSCQPKV